MPTKAGLMKQKELCNGVTVWTVNRWVDGHGNSYYYYPQRLITSNTPVPIGVSEIVNKCDHYKYKDHLVYFRNERGSALIGLSLLECGFDVPGAPKGHNDRQFLFRKKKHAMRFYLDGVKYPYKPTHEEIMFARHTADSFPSDPTPPAVDKWPPLTNAGLRRIKDKRRYLRIPGQGMREVIVQKTGDLVFTQRLRPNKELQKALKSALLTLRERVFTFGKKDEYGNNRKVLARLPKEPANNRKARKAKQRAARLALYAPPTDPSSPLYGVKFDLAVLARKTKERLVEAGVADLLAKNPYTTQPKE
jgi:hypothetical protein